MNIRARFILALITFIVPLILAIVNFIGKRYFYAAFWAVMAISSLPITYFKTKTKN